MLGIRDNLTLATTKLRTRRIRLIVTLIVSGLLFTVLVAGSLVIRGTLASLESFTKDGFSNRFIVAGNGFGSPFSGLTDPAIMKRAEAIQKDSIAKKVADAKRLGIPYDPASEPKITSEGGPDGPKQIVLNTSHPAAKQAIRELVPEKSIVDILKSTAPSYGLKAVYSGTHFVAYDTMGSSFELAPIVAGKETTQRNNGYDPSGDSITGFRDTSQTLDDSLIKPFLLEGASLTVQKDGAVPILAPTDAVETLVGLKPLSNKATSRERLQRLKDIRSKARDLSFEVCYRNSAAVDLKNLAKQQADEVVANKGKADYIAPQVQYANGTSACSAMVVSKDTRTAEEKTMAAKLEQFKADFGAEGPQTSVVKFRIVGVLPHLTFGSSAFDIGGLISSLVTSTLGTGWFISDQAARTNPVMGKLIAQAEAGSSFNQAFAEFNDRAGQKRFLNERACQPNNSPGTSDPMADCRKEDKILLMPYGNPLAAVYDMSAGFKKGLRIALLILAGISAVIMMGTVGKIIADSRKETSVFRAVGAKRLDIAQIYLLYAGILAALAFVIALGLGLGLALLLEIKQSPLVSVQAVLAFNSPNADKVFHLIGFNLLDLLGIFAFAVVTGLVSAVLPLMTNLRRNPIGDMREE